MSKLDKFSTKIESDLGWRKKEISNLMLLSSSDNELLITKATILLLYSHWEGYIKNSCKVYLSFVSDLKINLNDLSLNFEAIQFKGMIKELDKSSDTLTLQNELKFLESIYSVKDKTFNINSKSLLSEKDKTIINTKDNLNIDILKSLLEITGIDHRNCIDTKNKYINDQLLNNRNKIAHGNKIDCYNQDFDLTLDNLSILKNLIFTIMDTIKDDIIFYAENDLFLYKNKSLKNAYDHKSNLELEKKINLVFQ